MDNIWTFSFKVSDLYAFTTSSTENVACNLAASYNFQL